MITMLPRELLARASARPRLVGQSRLERTLRWSFIAYMAAIGAALVLWLAFGTWGTSEARQGGQRALEGAGEEGGGVRGVGGLVTHAPYHSTKAPKQHAEKENQ